MLPLWTFAVFFYWLGGGALIEYTKRAEFEWRFRTPVHPAVLGAVGVRLRCIRGSGCAQPAAILVWHQEGWGFRWCRAVAGTLWKPTTLCSLTPPSSLPTP